MRHSLLPILFAFAATAAAQQLATAGITGIAVDAQGAAIAGVRIVLTDVARAQDHTVASNAAGLFAFPSIPVGKYQLLAEKSGFRAFEQRDIVLEVNDNRRIDVRLEVGDVTTRITVEAPSIAVDTTSATLKSVVDEERIVELPLNGRNVASLTALTAGVIAVGTNSGDSKDAAGASTFSVNGSRQNSIKFTLDGGDNQDNLQNVNMPFPFPDAVEEFSVQTSNAGAEIGKSSAAAVNVVTKSGTNQFHGDIFWFIRNTDWNASSYFAHQSDALKRNQAGGTLGGPVMRNRLFFFGGFQETWIRSSPTESKTLTVPAAYRQGDFSALLKQAKPVTITDPTTNTPFPNNVIPQTRLSPAAEKLLTFSPAPSTDGYDHWRVTTPSDYREYISRLDYRLTDRQSFTARYYQNDTVNARTIVPTDINTVANTESTYSKNGTLSYNFVASPSLLAQTRFTVARTYGQRTNTFPYTIEDMGVAVSPTSNQISVSINGTSGLSISTSNPPAVFARTNMEAAHSWTWTTGRHTVSWGGTFLDSRYNEYNAFQGSGTYSFNGRTTGFDQADFVLGQMSGFAQSNGEIEFRRAHYFGLFASDSFRVSRRLTLNFGLRWEPDFPVTDLNDREAQFSQKDKAAGLSSSRYVNAPPGLFYPGDSPNGRTIPKAGVSSSKTQFGPRLGLAWDATGDGKTSVRAGYGVFYDAPEMYILNNMNNQTPFSFTVSFQDGLFDNPYQGRQNLDVFPYSGDFNRNSAYQLPTAAVVYDPVWKQPYAQDWNVTVDRSIGSWIVTASYVGTKGTDLIGNRDENAPIYNPALTLAQNQATIQARRPRQQYQGITALFTGLNSEYNAGQLTVRKRFTRTFTVQGAYTYSRAIDELSKNAQITSDNVQNPFNARMARGPSDYDRSHLLTASYVWLLPQPKEIAGSRDFASVVGGWQWSGLLYAATGTPFGINSTNDAVASAGTAFAKLTGNLGLGSGRSRGYQIAEYFNILAVTQADPGTYGNLGRNTLRNPDGTNLDTRISRLVRLKFRETASLQMLFEAFSALNHPQLGAPDNRLGRTTFGQIATVTGQRVLQFGLKLGF